MGGSESDEIKYSVNESMVARKEFVKEQMQMTNYEKKIKVLEMEKMQLQDE